MRRKRREEYSSVSDAESSFLDALARAVGSALACPLCARCWLTGCGAARAAGAACSSGRL